MAAALPARRAGNHGDLAAQTLHLPSSYPMRWP
jgi:hypothetical protein